MPFAFLAYNLNCIRRSELEDSMRDRWDLLDFVSFVLKVGGEMIKHLRRHVLWGAALAEPLWTHLIDRLSS
ncbi:hypothetical protein [Novipirellula sp.]|uniref:hypothetical protein n=1 Tax=Novipirellula sp. TaxID=2795430 RepID=UPI0035658DC9